MANTDHILTRQGCPLHYWLEGEADKPLLVLTHGATLDHRMFDAQRAALLPLYRLLTWDMRGHGDSQPMGDDFTVTTAVDDLLAILDEIGVRRAIFLGQSTGGYVVQELVFRHPERVEALVMVDCICITQPLSAMEAFLLRLTPALLSLYPDKLLKKQTATQSSIHPDIQAYIYEAASRIPKRDIITIWRGIASCLHAEPGYQIKQPLLLVHGDQDTLGSIARDAPAWAAREPHCQYVIIPNAGHCANQDNPTSFNEVLLSFLIGLKQRKTAS